MMPVRRFTYCPDCGTRLETRIQEERPRDYCPACERIHFQQLKVGAGAVIVTDGRLLLLQRSTAPFRGSWNLPAGYVEADESPYQAVVREVSEETGLGVEVERLLGVYYFDDDPRGNGILIVFQCRIVSGEVSVSSEAQSARFFAPDRLPKGLAGGAHDRAIMDWVRHIASP